MAKHAIDVVMKATDHASEKIADLGDTVEDTGEQTEGFAGIADIAKGALGAFAIKEAGQAIVELGRLGAESLRTKQAFDAISGGSVAAAANLEAMQVATRGAMSEQDMMSNANLLLQMGLVSNAQELGNVTEMATRLGAAMGTEAGPAIENFAMMLANQSLPRLDTFGISSGRVRKRIEELQAATEGLTREQAFMQAVTEEGTEAMGRLGDAVEDELLGFERLEATTADLKAQVGELVAGPLGSFVGLLATGVDELMHWDTRIKQMYGGVGAFALHLVGADEAAVGLVTSLGLIEDEIPVTSGLMDVLGYNAQLAAEQLDEETAAMEAAAEAALDTDDVMKLFTDTLKDNEVSTLASSRATDQLSEALGITATAQEQNRMDAELLAAAYQGGVISLEQFRYKMQQAAEGTLALSEVERQSLADQTAAARATRDLAAAHEAAAGAAAEQATTTMNLASSLKDATDATVANKLTEMLDPKAMGAEAYTQAVTGIGVAFGTMDAKSIALSGNLGTLATAIQSGVVPAQDADEALAALIEDAEDGTVTMDDLLAQFERAPEEIDPAAAAADKMQQRLGDVEDAGPGAERAVGGFGSSAETATPSIAKFGDALGTTQSQLEALVAGSPWSISVVADSVGGGGGGGGGRGGPPEGMGGYSQRLTLAPIIVQAGDVMTPAGALDMAALAAIVERGRVEYL